MAQIELGEAQEGMYFYSSIYPQEGWYKVISYEPSLDGFIVQKMNAQGRPSEGSKHKHQADLENKDFFTKEEVQKIGWTNPSSK